MGQWEYRTVPLGVEKDEYTLTFVSGRKIYGLQAILEESDAHGWEFIQMVPTPYNDGLLKIPVIHPGHYTAIFRRPRPGQQWQEGRLSGPFGMPEE